MIQFAVTVFIRLQAATYKVIFWLFHVAYNLTIKGGLHFLFLLFLGTFFRPTLFSHSILFSITCTSVAGGIMFNRRQL